MLGVGRLQGDGNQQVRPSKVSISKADKNPRSFFSIVCTCMAGKTWSRKQNNIIAKNLQSCRKEIASF